MNFSLHHIADLCIEHYKHSMQCENTYKYPLFGMLEQTLVEVALLPHPTLPWVPRFVCFPFGEFFALLPYGQSFCGVETVWCICTNTIERSGFLAAAHHDHRQWMLSSSLPLPSLSSHFDVRKEVMAMVLVLVFKFLITFQNDTAMVSHSFRQRRSWFWLFGSQR